MLPVGTHVEIGQSSHALPVGKRYLKDYPDCDKRYDARNRITWVKDSTGVELYVCDHLAERLVLEDTEETRLQQMARRSILMKFGTRQEFLFCQEAIREFGEEEFNVARSVVFEEHSALASPQAREIAQIMMTYIQERAVFDAYTRKNMVLGEDGQWHHRPGLIGPREVFQFIGRGILDAHAELQREHPIAMTSIKVGGLALALFFLHSLRCAFAR